MDVRIIMTHLKLRSQMRLIVAVLFPVFLSLAFLILLSQVMLMMMLRVLLKGNAADSYVADDKADAT